MTALVDTSVLADRPRLLAEASVVSVVTVGELEAGVLAAGDATRRSERLRRLANVLAEYPIVAVDRAVATRYGELRAATGRKPANDLWIAATALAHDLTLVTADRRLAALPLVRTHLVAED